jgi:hypothetical protein
MWPIPDEPPPDSFRSLFDLFYRRLSIISPRWILRLITKTPPFNPTSIIYLISTDPFIGCPPPISCMTLPPADTG